MSSANLGREEAAARSHAISLQSIAVDLDLTGAPDPQVTGFSTLSTLTFDSTTTETWIDFIGQSVESVTLNGHGVDVDWDGARIALSGLAEHNVVEVRATAAYSRSGEGMHRYVDPADGQTYLYTQYEPADSRRVMACFEQPDLKAAYSFTVSAPLGWSVLSNGVATHITTTETTQRVQFAQTKPISSYITCVTAGPYHRVDSHWSNSAQQVDLGVLCRASLAENLDADEIFEVTKQGLDFFTTAFDYEYPWGKYDQIFVPEYNLGAMENPGLVTFTESYVFRGASTRAQHEARANTILHEMAHMWFGDLVTMRWWDDLWLKESFADYMGAHASAQATSFTDAWVSFANRRKAWAYQQDQLPTTHPIVANITDLEAAKLNFDGITYAKGASVLKQLVAYVGEEAFFEAARRYFRRHEYGNTTLEDLLSVLEEVSGKDIHEWSRAWLETSGVTTLTVTDAGQGDLTITQDAPRPHSMQLATFDWSGEPHTSTLIPTSLRELTLTDATTLVSAPAGALRLLNEGDWTYAKVRLDDQSLDAVETGLSTIDSPLSRALVWSSLWNATRDGELATSRYVKVVSAHAPRESNVAVQTGVLGNTFYAIENYVGEEYQGELRAAWASTVWAALEGAEPGSGSQLAWARAAADIASVTDELSERMAAIVAGTSPGPAGLELDNELRWQWITALAARGHVDAVQLDMERERDNTGSGATHFVQAMASRPTAEVRDAAWSRAWTDENLSNEHLSATIAGFGSGARPDLTAKYAGRYFDLIGQAWSSRSIEIARRLVLGFYPASDTADLGGAWLAANDHAPAALRRLVTEQRDHVQRAVAARACEHASHSK